MIPSWGLRGLAAVARTRTGRGALYGAGAGAAWGMMSDDTSVVGGALIGAGLGAAATIGARAALGRMRLFPFGGGGGGRGPFNVLGPRPGGGGLGARMLPAGKGSVLSANSGFNPIRSPGRSFNRNPLGNIRPLYSRGQVSRLLGNL